MSRVIFIYYQMIIALHMYNNIFLHQFDRTVLDSSLLL